MWTGKCKVEAANLLKNVIVCSKHLSRNITESRSPASCPTFTSRLTKLPEFTYRVSGDTTIQLPSLTWSRSHCTPNYSKWRVRSWLVKWSGWRTVWRNSEVQPSRWDECGSEMWGMPRLLYNNPWFTNPGFPRIWMVKESLENWLRVVENVEPNCWRLHCLIKWW